jgi:hypothetical protein
MVRMGYAKTLGTVVDEAILLLKLLVEGKGDKKVGRQNRANLIGGK